MSKVYVGQTKLTINFSLTADITGYSSVTASVRKPGGSIGSWTITVDDASTGACSYANFTAGTLATSGNYYVQPSVFFGTNEAPCDTAILKVFKAYE